MKKTVAVFGDSTADTPALKQADIGLAMSDATEVAKSASDMILLSQNLQAIISGVVLGRNLIDSSRSFNQYKMMSIVMFFSTILIFAIFDLGEAPGILTILWVRQSPISNG